LATSDLLQLPAVVDVIEEINPGSVLDVGCGFGRYGFLCRELLDGKMVSDGSGGFVREPWRLRIVGIEAMAQVIGPWHANIFDEVRIGEALDLLPGMDEGSFDLVLAVDVIEHMPKKAGLELIAQGRRVGRSLLVCTPYLFRPQGPSEHNPRDRHVSGWLPAEFRSLGAKYAFPLGMACIGVWTDLELNLPKEAPEPPFNDRYLDLMRALFATYANTAQFTEAARTAATYLERRPTDIDVLCLAGWVHEQLKDRDQARKLYEQALAVDPESQKAKSCMARIEAAE